MSIDFGKTAYTLCLLKAGMLRALAIGSDKRLPQLNGVPTLVESGLPGFVSLARIGVVVPRRTPDEIVQHLAKAWRATPCDARARERLMQLGLESVGGSLPAVWTVLQNAMEGAAKAIKIRGVKVD